MKFLKEDGTVEDGTPLTDWQARTLERFTEYLHEYVCKNSYHASYSAKPCDDAAKGIVPKLDDSACGALYAALFKSEAQPEPVPEPVPEPPTVAVPADDIPF